MKDTCKISEIYKDTYVIENKISLGNVYLYLLVGKEKAMLIDTGYGDLDLKKIVTKITDKPVFAVITHGHIDHAMGAFQLEQSYIHSKEYEVFQTHSSKEFFESCFFDGLVLSISKKLRNSKDYRDGVEKLASIQRPFPQLIDNIKSFDLGNRPITWINTPGHTPGSICIADEKNGILFSGDNCAAVAWLQLKESMPIGVYKENLQRLIIFCQEKKLSKHYQSHTPKAKKIVDISSHIRCCDKILAHKKSFKVNMKLMTGYLIFSGLTGIVYK